MTNIFPAGSRVVGYCRDSGGRDQDLSTTQQREAIGKFCAEQGLILSHVFEDAARSGANTTGRQQFLEMIEYFSNQPQEKGIILWEFARLSRDYDDLMFYVSDLKRQGYVVHSISDAVPEGLEGSLLLGVKAYANAKYLLDLKKNVRRGLHYVVNNHHAQTAHAPFGYVSEQETIGKRRDGSPHKISHIIPDPITAPIVIRAFEMRSQGMITKEIDSELHIFPWLSGYGRMFDNKIYLGIKEYGDDTIENYCPPIVSLDTWENVRRLQDERKKKSGYNHPRSVRSRFWLSGVLFCSRCKKSMHGHIVHKAGQKQYDYFRCTSKEAPTHCDNQLIRKDRIESLVLKQIQSVILDPMVLNEITQKAQEMQTGTNSIRTKELSKLSSELRQVKKEINRIISAIQATGHSRAMLDRLKDLETKRDELSVQIDNHYTKPSTQTNLITIDDITRLIARAIDNTSDRERGSIMRELIKKVEAGCEHKKISGRITFKPTNLSEIVVDL